MVKFTEDEKDSVRRMYEDACRWCVHSMSNKTPFEGLDAKKRMGRYDILIKRLLEAVNNAK